MKKIIYTLFYAMAFVMAFVSCSDEETYADQKKRETEYIRNFIYGNSALADSLFHEGIESISELQFMQQGYVTLAPPAHSKYQFVLFESTGVYMHIANNGCGEKIKKGESTNVLCRFNEYNLNAGVLQLSNMNNLQNAVRFDRMAVMNTSGTFTASFTNGLLASVYQSLQVPSGWLVPLPYINIGRPIKEEEQEAHVYLVVPHGQGQGEASKNVYACLYDIYYQRGN